MSVIYGYALYVQMMIDERPLYNCCSVDNVVYIFEGLERTSR